MGTDIGDSYMMMHVLNNVSSMYDNVVENMEDKLDATIDPLTLETLREKLSENFETIKRRRKFNNEEEDRTTRITTTKSSLPVVNSKADAINGASLVTRPSHTEVKRTMARLIIIIKLITSLRLLL